MGDSAQNIVAAYPGAIPYGGGGDSLFRIAWRGKWFIVLAALLGLGGAYAYVRRLPAEYASISRILVSVPNPQSKSDIPLPVVSKPNLMTQASMITSPVIVRVALSDPNVLAVSGNPGRSLQDLTRKLAARVGKDDIISVSASTPWPEGAAAIVNAVVQAYTRWHEQNKRVNTADFLANLNKQLTATSEELKRKRLALKVAEERTPGIAEGDRGSLISSTLELLKQELVTMRLQLIQLNSFKKRLESLQEDPNKFRQYVYGQQSAVGITVDNAEWVRATEELDKTRLQLEELLAGGPVQRSQITLLQNREGRLVQRIRELEMEFMPKYMELANTLMADAIGREKALTDEYTGEAAKIQGVGKDNAEHTLLVSECDILEKQYGSLCEQISKVPADSGQSGVDVYVLEKAVPAAEPASPMMRILGIGLVLGLMVGGGLAFLWDWRDQTVRSAEEIVMLLGVPILGAVPTLRRRALWRRPQVPLASHGEEFEAYRAIRTALLFGVARGDGKTLLVTSPGALEGKTTLVGHLGVAMAQAGQRTLIVDADLRKPTLHRIFANGSQGKGLVEVLGGAVALEEAIRPTKTQGLDVLEGGQSARNPSELLGGEVFGSIFERLQDRYDRILVDSPPIGICADAQVLAARCGSTMLVLRARRSSRMAVQKAREALSTVSANVVGVVVNDVARRDTRYSHYRYGAYGRYGGSDGTKRVRKELSAEVEGPAQDGAGAAETRTGNGEVTDQKGPDDLGARP
jgi:capsular exopolysaccharide synthesis family protein